MGAFMAEQTNEEKSSERISFLKRNCMLCKGRSRLRSAEPEKQAVQSGLKNLVGFFDSEYNGLRKEDAPVEAINNAIDNKRLCMDLIEECNSCDKEVDRVNRGLNKVKR